LDHSSTSLDFGLISIYRAGMKILSALFLICFCGSAQAAALLEPHIRFTHARDHDGKQVALTLDACTGKVDERILQVLIDNKIHATIFVTARWLKRNPQAIAQIKANKDLFEIENHGAKHLPAVDVPMDVFGVAAAGSPDEIAAEVEDGAAAISDTFGTWPKWYRGATAQYNAPAIEMIKSLNFKIAGFSLSGDGGASFSAARAAKAMASAKSGDVIIAHMNQPTKPAGQGVAEGLLKLKAEGFEFVKLDQVF
jgi:peptidoglycan/xylan/chitin deacetylase (PgdA/CDA1 family)